MSADTLNATGLSLDLAGAVLLGVDGWIHGRVSRRFFSQATMPETRWMKWLAGGWGLLAIGFAFQLGALAAN